LSLDFGCIDHFCQSIPDFRYGEIGQDSVDEVFSLNQTPLPCKDIKGFPDIDIIHQKLGFL
jgi:hypothetical protein